MKVFHWNVLLCAIIVVACALPAAAGVYTWTGTSYTTGNDGNNYYSYDWSNSANWGSAGVPNGVGMRRTSSWLRRPAACSTSSISVNRSPSAA